MCLGSEVWGKYRNEVWQCLMCIDHDNSHLIRMRFDGTILYTCCLLFSWRYVTLWLYFYSPVAGFSLLVFARFLDHTQRRATFGRTPLDE
jgi:hypothetical protein